MLLYSFLYESAMKYSNRNAIIFNGRTYSYSQILSKSNSLAKLLKENISESEKNVACIMNNSLELVTTIFALSKNKKVPVLLNPNFSSSELLQKLENANVKSVVIERDSYIRLMKQNTEQFNFFIIDGVLADRVENNEPVEVVDIEEINMAENAVVQTSSGTTNISKMAYRSNENLYEDSANIISTFDYNKNDIVYAAVPLYHGYGLTMGLIAPIRNGMTIVFERIFMPNRFLQDMKQYEQLIFLGVPETYQLLSEYIGNDRFSLKNVKLLICSSSALNKEIGNEIYNKTGKWINQLYGMMEVSTIAANLNPNKNNFMSVGKTADNVELKIVEGKIYVKSKTVSNTYIIEGKNKKIDLVDGWFMTGDTGYIKDGNLYIGKRVVTEK